MNMPSSSLVFFFFFKHDESCIQNLIHLLLILTLISSKAKIKSQNWQSVCKRVIMKSPLTFFQPSYGLAIRTEGMVEDLVKNLKSLNPELQMHCASAIFKVSSS